MSGWCSSFFIVFCTFFLYSFFFHCLPDYELFFLFPLFIHKRHLSGVLRAALVFGFFSFFLAFFLLKILFWSSDLFLSFLCLLLVEFCSIGTFDHVFFYLRAGNVAITCLDALHYHTERSLAHFPDPLGSEVSRTSTFQINWAPRFKVPRTAFERNPARRAKSTVSLISCVDFSVFLHRAPIYLILETSEPS